MNVRRARPLPYALLTLILVAGCASPKTEAKAADSARVRELVTEYRATLLDAEQQAEALYANGTVEPGVVMEFRIARLRADLDLCTTAVQRIAVLSEILDVEKQQEVLANQRFAASVVSELDVIRAKARRLEAEIALEREKGQ